MCRSRAKDFENKYSPFPEEMNRQVTDVLSDSFILLQTQKESAAKPVKRKSPQWTTFISLATLRIDALKETIQRILPPMMY